MRINVAELELKKKYAGKTTLIKFCCRKNLPLCSFFENTYSLASGIITIVIVGIVVVTKVEN